MCNLEIKKNSWVLINTFIIIKYHAYWKHVFYKSMLYDIFSWKTHALVHEIC